MFKCRDKVFLSPKGPRIMKIDWIMRLSTLVLYVGFSLGFSVWLPMQFCELIGVEVAKAASCKWQVFGFRLIFILLSYPMEAILLAVEFRHATDMIFKMELRRLTGANQMNLGGRKQSNIGYLMDPDVALNARNVFVGS